MSPTVTLGMQMRGCGQTQTGLPGGVTNDYSVPRTQGVSGQGEELTLGKFWTKEESWSPCGDSDS